VNLPYILWTAAFNVSFLLGYLSLDLLFRPPREPRKKARSRPATPASPAPPAQAGPPTGMGTGAPPLLEALNRNGLAVFLLVRLFFLPGWSVSLC
jgi:phosphatidylinositol glycan class W